jgi:hypothetical protein
LSGESVFGVALGDVDSDGDLDALTTSTDTDSANTLWLYNAATNEFYDSGQSLGNERSAGVALGDIDSDGYLDAFVGMTNSPDTVWVNDGSGTFSNSGQTLDELGYTFDAEFGDLNGDGNPDIFAGSAAYPVWLNDGSGTFADNGQIGMPSLGIGIGDLDGDSDLDVFWTTDWQNKVWLNDGNGTFTDTGQGLGTLDSCDVALGDLDSDGDLDAFVVNGDSPAGENKVWLNDGSGTFTDSGQSLVGDTSNRGVALGDLDIDGDLDALVTTDSGLEVWLNDGGGLFTDSGLRPGEGAGRRVQLGDFDRDGDLDAFVTTFYGSEVWWNGLDARSPVTTASPPGGLYNAVQTVTLSCDDADGSGCATIYYTTDGSMPTTVSSVYSGSISIFSEGETKLKFFSIDNAGNTDAVNTEAYTIDTTPSGTPLVSATTPTTDTTPTWSWTSRGGGIGTYCFELDDSDLTSGATETTSTSYTPGSALSEGSHTLYVQERDDAENWSSSGSATVSIDLSAPTTTASPVGGIYNSRQSVTLTCDDGDGSGCATVYYTTDGSTPTTLSSIYNSAISISYDTTLNFFSTDNAGNAEAVNTETYTIIDTTAPTVSITSPGYGVISDNTPTLTFTVTDNVSMSFTEVVKVDGSVVSKTSGDNLDTLTDGSHTVRVEATDEAGNTGYEEVTFTVDTTYPDISVSSTSLSFGRVDIGSSDDISITVSNSGNDTLNMGTIAGSDGLATPFSITGDGCSAQAIAPSGNCTITVRFSPTVSGSYSDTFNIPSNDPDEGTVTASVEGESANVILFQYDYDGQIYLWYLSGTTVTGGASTDPVSMGDPTWKVVGTPDMNNDGYADILFQRNTGRLYLWYMRGTDVEGSTDLYPRGKGSPAWKVVGTPDMNRDGHADILFQNEHNGKLYLWWMSDAASYGSTYLSPKGISPRWKVVGTPDMNGDGWADIMYQRDYDGLLNVLYMQGTTGRGGTIFANTGDPQWKVVSTPDMNGDGWADILFQHEHNGALYLWYMEGITATGGTGLSQNPGNPLWRAVGAE